MKIINTLTPYNKVLPTTEGNELTLPFIHFFPFCFFSAIYLFISSFSFIFHHFFFFLFFQVEKEKLLKAQFREWTTYT